MKVFILLSIAAVFCCSFHSHKFYVSDTLIEHSTVTQSYQITLKIFTDDLEMALGGDSLHLGSEEEVVNAGMLVETYINNHLEIRFNDQPQMLSYIGKENEADMTICYLEMMQNTDFDVLMVENTLLLEHFPDQRNIVKINVGGRSQTFLLNSEHTSETILH
ncbi:MAG: DUF6702 family protein [Flavobacteriales bacterium]